MSYFANIRESFDPLLFYIKKYKRLYFIGFIALVVVDVLEIFPPLILKYAVDNLNMSQLDGRLLLLLALLYIAIALVQGWMRYLWRMYIGRTSMLAGNDMRQKFFMHLTNLAPAFYKKKKVGELISLGSNDTESMRFALGPAVIITLDALIYFLTVLPVMFYISPKLALLSLLPMIFVPIFTKKMMQKLRKYFTAVQERFADLSAHSQESLNGVRVIKGTAQEPLKEQEFDELGKKYIDANVKSAFTHSSLNSGLEFILSVSITLLFVVGGGLVLQENVTIGLFVAFQRYIQTMAWPVEAIGISVAFFQRAFASQKRLAAVESQKNEIIEENTASQNLSDSIPLIELRNLNFYHGENHILKDISLTIKPGERIGIVGAIGSGKTTLLNCIARVESIARGQLFFDGIDANDIPLEQIREKIAVVQQESFLFSENIVDNVLYGSAQFDNKDADSRLDFARSAAKKAHILDEIQFFPEKFDTVLGERGLNISGGQKQRLSIARAYAREPQIMIFDDCLSAVDSLTERLLKESFLTESENRSFLFSSHRISSLEGMDKIIVLDEGKLVESGAYEQLKQQNGKFAELHHQQMMASFTEFQDLNRGGQHDC